MSIKIYQAWRCPLKNLNDTIDSFRGQMLNMAMDHLERLMLGVEKEAIGTCPNHLSGDETGVKLWERSKRLDIVLEICKEAAKKNSYSRLSQAFDIECGVNIWVYKNKAYFMPIAPRYMTNNLIEPVWCEEYRYWNNVDPPEEISTRQWNARRKTWGNICLDDHNKTRLYHEVISAQCDLDLFEIRDKIAGKEIRDHLDNLSKLMAKK